MSGSSTQEANVASHKFNLLTSPEDIQEVVETEYPESNGRKTTAYIATQSIRELNEAEQEVTGDYLIMRVRATRTVHMDDRPLRVITRDQDVKYYLRRSRQTNGEQVDLVYDRDEAELDSLVSDDFEAGKLIEHLDVDEEHHDLPINKYVIALDNPELERIGRAIHHGIHGVDLGEAYHGPFVLVFSTRTLSRTNPDDEAIYEQVGDLHDEALYWSNEGLNWNRNVLELEQMYSAEAWADTSESKGLIPHPLGGRDLSLRQAENILFAASPGKYDKYGFADSLVAAEVVREVFGNARTGYRVYNWDDRAGWYQTDVIQ